MKHNNNENIFIRKNDGNWEIKPNNKIKLKNDKLLNIVRKTFKNMNLKEEWE